MKNTHAATQSDDSGNAPADQYGYDRPGCAGKHPQDTAKARQPTGAVRRQSPTLEPDDAQRLPGADRPAKLRSGSLRRNPPRLGDRGLNPALEADGACSIWRFWVF